MHKYNKVCDQFARCDLCYKTCKRKDIRPENHNCLRRKCKNCRLYVSSVQPHTCYIQKPQNNLEEPSYQRYIFFDFETYPDPFLQEHIPNFVAIFLTCAQCIGQRDKLKIPTACCGDRRISFFGKDVLKKTVDFIFFDEEKKGSILLCHYGSKIIFNKLKLYYLYF